MTSVLATLARAEELLRRAAKVVETSPGTPKFAAELTAAAAELAALPRANTEADVELERLARCLESYATGMGRLHRDIADDFRRAASIVRASALSLTRTAGDWRKAYAAWQSAPLSIGADPEHHEIIEAAFRGGYQARDKLILRLIADAEEERVRADSLTRPAGGEEVVHHAAALLARCDQHAADIAEPLFWQERETLRAALTKPPALPKDERLAQLIHEARVAATGTRLTNRERCDIRALCDAAEAMTALPKEGEEAIPHGIYFNEEHGNFYDARRRNAGMGEEFMREWADRRWEFPATPQAALSSLPVRSGEA